MIFAEKKDGLKIWIPHKEMMNEDTMGFVYTILKARAIYQRNANADMDHDDRAEE